MSDLLSIGTSGIKAYSRALSTISDNIANAQTPGYARRSVQLEEARASGDLVLYRNNIRPGGVAVAGVARAVDEWLINDSRVASGDASRYSARLEWMAVAEKSLDDGADGVGSNLTAIFTAADQLSAIPGDNALRTQFLQAVDATAIAFRRTATSLAAATAGIGSEAQSAVNQVNNDLVALQRVNDGLLRARDGSTNAATLLDERDRLIDQISAATGVDATFDSHGVVRLQASGPGAAILLDGPLVASLSVVAAVDGRIGYAITPGTGTFSPVTGSLAGLADAAGAVADRRANLDALAATVVADLNGRHQVGFDSGGTSGLPLLSLGSGAISMTATGLSPGQVAAADAAGSNGNILAFAALRGAGGAEAGWAAIVNAHAQAVAASRAQEAASSVRRDGAFDARNAVSEIDLDHEAAELLRFQQAYEAAARTIQVARETMQTIFSIF